MALQAEQRSATAGLLKAWAVSLSLRGYGPLQVVYGK